MLKLKNLSKMAMVAFFGLSFSLSAHAASFKNLAFMGYYPEAHPTASEVFLPLLDKIKKDFNGKLSFNYYSAGVLYPVSESYDVFNDDRVDVGVIRAATYPNVTGLATIVDLPGMAPNAIVGSLLAEDLMVKFPAFAKEFPENTLPLAAWSSPTYQYHSLKPIKTYEEFKTQKVIVWDANNLEVVKKLGAIPILIPSSDTYLALSKGMADGVYCGFAPVRSYKLSDVVKNHLILDFGVVTFNIFANRSLFNEMPKDMQDYILSVSGEKLAFAAGKSLEDATNRDAEWLKRNGHTFHTIPAKDREIMVNTVSNFSGDWVKRMEAKGHKNAQEILDYTIERSAYYTDLYNQGKYDNYPSLFAN